ncbi:MAG TPA: tetratricopeptide repeat protein [Anaerolineales bacterium]|nr:tetratricopeptide repeat protein [Anaerolineales bacterium]
MAKVSLRIYNKDIEQLIDQGHQDEAIAHCRHILQTFPKHLDTYRLLGKAYLEAKRYDEAVDVFQRVLMAVPDDFVSHVGMSIIRDDQGKLDEAIWHMERAFESQPSNAAIQGELQRLFGRRDGMEPPKIRMTRGALAHMYVQGELYPQAISEIKAVLSQDSQRDDMRTLLARAFFYAGQKADASDICSQLLNHYPYSLDANRIMVELLQGSDTVDATQVYRQRVNELDPYAAQTQGSVFHSSEVSDAAVNLERLEYKGQDVQMTSDWRDTGINLGPQTTNQEPDWLKTDIFAPVPEEKPAPVAPASSDIPDFLRAAGWTESSGAQEQPISSDIGSTPEPGLAPAEMPDWLKAMAPSEASQPPASIPAGQPPAATPAPASDVPDWLSGFGNASQSNQESADVPDWLKGFTATETTNQQPGQPETPAPAGDAPDWLRGLESKSTQPGQEAASGNIPDWLKSFDETSATPAQAAPSAPAPVQGSKPVVSKPEPTPPMPPVTPPTPAPSISSTPAPSATLETLGTSAKEQDDAVAWLESLAAKHGAKSEELVTDPNARSEKPPAWVEQARAIGESEAQSPAKSMAQPPAEESTPVEPVEAPVDETGMWLRGLGDELTPKEEPPVPQPVEEVPALSADVSDWLKSLDEESSKPPAPAEPKATAELTPPQETEPVSFSVEGGVAESPELSTDLPSWLKDLDKEEASPTSAPAPGEGIPEWLKGDTEVAPQETERMTPMDWHPVEEPQAMPEMEIQPEPELPTPIVEEPVPTPEPPAPKKAPAPKPAPAKAVTQPRPVAKEPPTSAVRKTSILSPSSDPALAAAQTEMNRGDIPAAIEHYNKLIKKGRWLEEIIRDLRDALYRYPVEVTIWQALGDAYMRANRLQDALDSYTKAEELLR